MTMGLKKYLIEWQTVQTLIKLLLRSSLIWVCTIHSGMSVPIFRVAQNGADLLYGHLPYVSSSVYRFASFFLHLFITYTDCTFKMADLVFLYPAT